MGKEDAKRDEMDAYIREADARLRYLEAQARAHEASEEMEEISDLRARRQRLQDRVSSIPERGREAWDDLRRGLEDEWREFRRAVDDVHSRYSDWDSARERRFNARLDEASALVAQWTAKAAQFSASTRGRISDASEDLKRKSDNARAAYNVWRDQRQDERLQRKLDDAELDLEAAYDRLERASREVEQRKGQEGGDWRL